MNNACSINSEIPEVSGVDLFYDLFRDDIVTDGSGGINEFKSVVGNYAPGAESHIFNRP